MAKIYKGLTLDCLYAWGYCYLEKDSLLHNNCSQRKRKNIAVTSYINVTTIKPLPPTPHLQCPLTFKNTYMLRLSEGQAVKPSNLKKKNNSVSDIGKHWNVKSLCSV
jgi:hypothetical protein